MAHVLALDRVRHPERNSAEVVGFHHGCTPDLKVGPTRT
jgi:hypothetical protein